MRKNVKEFVEIVRDTFDVNDPIYEFGSLQVKGQVGFADLRPLFVNKDYVGCDMQPGPGVDRILNLHQIDMESETVGTIICLDTLEHVEYPRKAIEEMFRILKPDGMIIISSVMNFPIHGYPNDYWRYTPEGFGSLLSSFRSFYIQYQGLRRFPHTIVGVGQKGGSGFSSAFVESAEKWRRSDLKSLRQWVLLITPPVLIPVIAWLYNRLIHR